MHFNSQNYTKFIYRDEREEQHEHPSAAAVNSAQLEMPQDGYDWKKYGQKYIHNIKKIRYINFSPSSTTTKQSYYDCVIDLHAI